MTILVSLQEKKMSRLKRKDSKKDEYRVSDRTTPPLSAVSRVGLYGVKAMLVAHFQDLSCHHGSPQKCRALDMLINSTARDAAMYSSKTGSGAITWECTMHPS